MLNKLICWIFRLVIRYYSGKAIEERRNINKLYQKFISPLKSNVAKVNGNIMVLDKYDSSCLSITGVYEEFATEVIKQIIKEGAMVLDIGAYIGYYTLLFAKLVGNKGKVFAFEPSPDNFRILIDNVKVNNYANVEAIQKAAGFKEGKAILFLHDFNTGRNRMALPYGQKSIEVEVVNLDKYFIDYIKPFNFIKIDAEGMEYDILKGMARILTGSNDIKIMIEFFPRYLDISGADPKEFLSLLKQYRFKYYRINEWRKKLEDIGEDKLLKQYTVDKNNYTNLLCTKEGQNNIGF